MLTMSLAHSTPAHKERFPGQQPFGLSEADDDASGSSGSGSGSAGICSSSSEDVASGDSTSSSCDAAGAGKASTSGSPKKESRLKRKRPQALALGLDNNNRAAPRAKVANIDLNMQALEHIAVEGKDHVFGVAATQGRRRHMEDTFHVAAELGGDVHQAVYSVFDGHGGRYAADYLADNLSQLLVSHPAFHTNVPAALSGAYQQASDLLNSTLSRSGSTAMTVVLKDGTCTLANLGDSRAVLVRETGVEVLSRDHNTLSDTEKDRIQKEGGELVRMGGVDRVQGVLRVTRAFGHPEYPFVGVLPEILSRPLTPQDEYLILATDGCWDVLSAQEAMDIIRSCSTAQEMSDALALEALNRASNDNITVVVVDLSPYRAS